MKLLSFELLVPVILVTGLFVLSAWLLQKLKNRSFGQNTAIRIHSAVSVGPNERILLVQIADHWLLVGSSPGQVNTLYTFDKPPFLPSAKDSHVAGISDS